MHAGQLLEHRWASLIVLSDLVFESLPMARAGPLSSTRRQPQKANDVRMSPVRVLCFLCNATGLLLPLHQGTWLLQELSLRGFTPCFWSDAQPLPLSRPTACQAGASRRATILIVQARLHMRIFAAIPAPHVLAIERITDDPDDDPKQKQH